MPATIQIGIVGIRKERRLDQRHHYNYISVSSQLFRGNINSNCSPKEVPPPHFGNCFRYSVSMQVYWPDVTWVWEVFCETRKWPLKRHACDWTINFINFLQKNWRSRFEKVLLNYGSFRGFIEKFSLFSNQSKSDTKVKISLCNPSSRPRPLLIFSVEHRVLRTRHRRYGQRFRGVHRGSRVIKVWRLTSISYEGFRAINFLKLLIDKIWNYSVWKGVPITIGLTSNFIINFSMEPWY